MSSLKCFRLSLFHFLFAVNAILINDIHSENLEESCFVLIKDKQKFDKKKNRFTIFCTKTSSRSVDLSTLNSFRKNSGFLGVLVCIQV